MIKVLFICHGNICRSTNGRIRYEGFSKTSWPRVRSVLTIASAATSREEIGNPVHRGTQKQIKTSMVYPRDGNHRATQDDVERIIVAL